KSNIWRKFKDADDLDCILCNNCCIQLNRVQNACGSVRVLLRRGKSGGSDQDGSEAKEARDTRDVESEASADAGGQNGDSMEKTITEKVVRKSTRSKRGAKALTHNSHKMGNNKGRSRRQIFKQDVGF